MPILEGDDGVYLVPDWSQRAYELIAVELEQASDLRISVIDPGDPTGSGYQGFRLLDLEDRFIDVGRMLVNWRVMEIPKGRLMPVPSRYWCYAGTDMTGLLMAVACVAAWGGDADSEPFGWSKNGQTGEGRR